MATVKISELPAILGANTAATDVIPIVDVSGNITNKITREEFFKNIQTDVEVVDKIVHSGDTNTAIRFPAADTVTVETSGAERLRIDSSGNVGIGTASPAAKLEVSGDIISVVSGTSSVAARSGNNTNYSQLRFRQTATESRVESFAAGTGTFVPLTFHVNSAERMRIDSSGNVLVGTTAAPAFVGSGHLGVKGGLGFLGGSASTYYYTIQSNTTDFYIGTSSLSRFAALVGLNTFTAWSFGSDRRIKDNIEDLDYGLQTVLAMRPRQYTLKDNDQFSIGFVAQELKDVVPEAVTGEEVPFEDGDTPQERAGKTMGVSKETLIPILVKAIQELKAEVDSLRAQLNP